MKTENIQRLNKNIEQLLGQEEKPLSFSEAAKYLDMSRSYLYKLTFAKRITFYKPGGKRIYFRKSDLDKYLYRNKKASVEELEEMVANLT